MGHVLHTEEPVPRSLDLVLTSVATQLMEATASSATQVSETVLAQLVEQFDVDASFLRHHDHEIQASVLVAGLAAGVSPAFISRCAMN